MSEELLAHLLATFDEELARRGDEREAAAAAMQRFGGPDELARELHASVPTLERLFYHLGIRKGAVMWRWLLILGVVALFVGPGFICPALAQLHEQGSMVALEVVLLVFGTALTLAGLVSLAYGIKQYRTRQP
jgi:hypothetical protein